MAFTSIFGLVTIALLTACASVPEQTTASTSAANAARTALAKPQLEFIDLAGFDRELSSSLTAKLPNVNVAVVNTVPANDIPVRMQAWLQAVEAGGGTVTVSPPKSTVAAKNPLILLTLVSGIWNSIKAHKAVQNYDLHKPARTYDAEIVLKVNEQGDRLIDKVIFTERKPT
jgi:hypothetical protein